MLRRLALFPLVLLLFASVAGAQDVSGSWTAKLDPQRPTELNVQFHVNKDTRSQLGMNIPVGDFAGLSPEAITAGGNLKFQLAREAGTTSFDGHFRNGQGIGEFAFSANPQYGAAMAELGYPDLSARKTFEMAIINVTTAYTRELQSLGFTPTAQKLIEARIFNVNREQIEGLKAVGYDNLSLKDLVELRIFNVTPDYIKEMRASGFDMPLRKLVEFRIHNVTPEFRREMSAAGYPDLSPQKLVEFRIHGIDRKFIDAMAALGFRELAPSKLVELKIFRVSAEQVAELKSLGYSGLSANDLVQLRIHNIDREFIEKVRRAGYKDPSISQLVEMKIMGIRLREERL